MKCSKCNKNKATLLGWQGYDQFGRRYREEVVCGSCADKIDAYIRARGYVEMTWVALSDICLDCYREHDYINTDVYAYNRCYEHYEQYIKEKKRKWEEEKKKWRVVKHEYIYKGR